MATSSSTSSILFFGVRGSLICLKPECGMLDNGLTFPQYDSSHHLRSCYYLADYLDGVLGVLGQHPEARGEAVAVRAVLFRLFVPCLDRLHNGGVHVRSAGRGYDLSGPTAGGWPP